ncbi:MAG: hypothetical protein OET79_04595 [Nitrospirota bacterium]|nr:hypothetical protein [Nitrospirota bacterium]
MSVIRDCKAPRKPGGRCGSLSADCPLPKCASATFTLLGDECQLSGPTPRRSATGQVRLSDRVHARSGSGQHDEPQLI